jgi:Arylsulfotransferase (ASST)
MARGVTGRATRALIATVVIVAAMAIGASSARAATTPEITARPALQPGFDPANTDYVTRCEPREHVRVSVADRGGPPISVDGHTARRGTFRTKLKLVAGQRFTLRTGTGATAVTYNVRCLPYDFPRYSVSLNGQPQAAYYLLTLGSAMTATPLPYVVLFDNHGVPVWWYQELNGVPDEASLLPNGNLAWEVNLGMVTIGSPATIQWEEHRLDGKVVRTLDSHATLSDTPEAQLQPNGDFLITTYSARTVPLAPLGSVGTTPIIDATVEEIRPDGSVVWSWDANGNIALTESQRWLFARQVYGRPPSVAWDTQHITSVESDGDGYLIAMAHTDAVYLIRRSDGAIEWKLGGTPTPQSLTILGDPDSATDFGGPHDAQLLPDGTISVFDNATYRNVVVPRVLRFRIDPVGRTATLVQALSDPAVTSSTCCGSARLLPGGDWVVDWGGQPFIDELGPDGSPKLQLRLAAPDYSYRAVPILPGQLSAAQVIGGMDRMYPRPHDRTSSRKRHRSKSRQHHRSNSGKHRHSGRRPRRNHPGA